MTTLARVDKLQNRGRAEEAEHLGQSFDVYRVTAATPAAGILAGSPIATRVRAVIKRSTEKKLLGVETAVHMPTFTGKLDVRRFKPGDVFVLRSDSYGADGAIYTLAARRPRELPVFVATQTRATISYNDPNPNAITSGRAPQSVPMEQNAQPLTLSAGAFAFVRAGTPAVVPIAMVMGRLRDFPKSDSAQGQMFDDTRRQTWDIYIPLLGSLEIDVRHVVIAGGDRFEITGVQTADASFFGHLATAQRIR
jgi:hypothetical protein